METIPEIHTDLILSEAMAAMGQWEGLPLQGFGKWMLRLAE